MSCLLSGQIRIYSPCYKFDNSIDLLKESRFSKNLTDISTVPSDERLPCILSLTISRLADLLLIIEQTGCNKIEFR